MDFYRRKVINTGIFIPLLINKIFTNSLFDPKLLENLRLATSIDQFLSRLGDRKFGNKIEKSSNIVINHQEIQRYGHQTPILVESKVKNTERIYFLVEENPVVFAIKFRVANEVIPKINFNIKVNQNSLLFAIVKANQNWYYQKSYIGIVIRGC